MPDRNILEQLKQILGGGIQSPAFPFVPPTGVPQDLGRIPVTGQLPTGQPMGQQVLPPTGVSPTDVIAPQLPTGITGVAGEGVGEDEEKRKEKNRKLLALALQVGLPLVLAGFGGERGLAAGAGLAEGFGEAATQRRKLEAFKDQPVFTVDPESGQLTQVGTTPKGAKVIKKPVKKVPKEDETLKALEKILGVPTVSPEEAGKVKAKEIQKITRETLPKGVTESDIKFTMKKHNLSREEVLRRLK